MVRQDKKMAGEASGKNRGKNKGNRRSERKSKGDRQSRGESKGGRRSGRESREKNVACGGILLLLVLLAGMALLSLRAGSASLGWRAFFGGLFRQPGYGTETTILWYIRLPRIVGAVLAGAGLSVSGVLLQGVTGNELAGPNIIGVNAGAGFAVMLWLFFLPGRILGIPLGAFCGAFLTTLLIVSLASRIYSSKSTVILAGIAVTAMLNAGISFFSLLDPDVLVSYNYFSVGGLSGVHLQELAVPAAIILAALLAALLLSRQIDILCLGDALASSLGVRVRRLRTLCLVLASASAAAVVSFAGLLGFVGLVAPHMARRLAGPGMKLLLPVAALLGAILVLAADLLGRILFAPSELPVGIVMALIGAPFFFWLLLRRRGVE